MSSDRGDPTGEVPRLLSREDLAQAWGTSTRTIDRLVASGELSAVRIGRSVRFRPADIEPWLEQQAKRSRGS